jgi:predicted ATP-grasp superfamily ATP-dependent carboligase
MITVLVYEFASGGGFAAEAPPGMLGEGLAMRDAVCLDLLALGGINVVAATTKDARLPTGARSISPALGEATTAFLRRMAATVDAVWLIAPESDGISLELTRLLEDIGANVIGCGCDAVALASSKSRTLVRLAAAGIATVPTWPLATAPLAHHDIWVVKPDRGCGCEAMRRLPLDAVGAMQATAENTGDNDLIIAQPWLDGDAMSLSLMVTEATVEILSVNRQHIEVAADGIVSLTDITRRVAIDVTLEAGLHDLAVGVVASIPGLRGFVGVDFILTERGLPVVLEVNPRLTSAYVGLSKLLGRNLADDLLRATITKANQSA